MGLSGADIVSALMLGLLGTGHCIGMCGPLVVAFPAQSGKLSGHLLYHAGRIATYTVIGALLGAASGTLLSLSTATAIQGGLSTIAAGTLVWLGLFRLGALREPRWMQSVSPHNLSVFKKAVRTAREGRAVALFPIGAVMGLIPCGLSFAAFARAIPSGRAGSGALLLLAFGLGTLPGLLLLGTAVSRLFSKHRAALDVAAALLMFAMGVELLADLWG